MPKRKAVERDWPEEIDKAVHQAVEAVPGLADLSDEDRLEAIQDGVNRYLELIESQIEDSDLGDDDTDEWDDDEE